MAELIPVGTNESAWFDVTVAPGQTKAVFIKSATANQVVPATVEFEVAYKNATNDYRLIDVINTNNIKNKGTITAPGTFGYKRRALSAADIAAGIQAGLNVEG